MSTSSDVLTTFDRATHLTTLHQAWDHVLDRASAPGIDRLSVQDFAANAAQRLERLAAALRKLHWRPRPARRVVLPDDPDRPIAVPTVRDRIVQRALALALGARYESTLDAAAHAYRPGRGVHTALRAVERALAAGARWVLRADIEKFFDRIDRDRLLAQLGADGVDEGALELVRRTLAAGVAQGGVFHDPGLGASQGSALSPLLSNIYLAPLDAAARDAGLDYHRYGDDLVVLGREAPHLGDAADLIAQTLVPLGLRLNTRKTRRAPIGAGFEFLGVHFDAHGRGWTRGAARAYEAGAVDRLADVGELASWAARWHAWYGVPRPTHLATPSGIAAALLGQGADLEASTVPAWAEARVALADGPLDAPAAGLALVRLWTRFDQDHAALVEARAALRAGASTDELATALGVEASAVATLWGADGPAARAFAACGATAFADVLRRSRAAPSPTSPTAGGSPDDAERWLARFAGAEALHLSEREDAEGHARFDRVHRPLGVDDVLDHLAGGRRRGVLPVRADGTVGFGCLEVRVRRAALLPQPGQTQAPKHRWQALEALAHDDALRLARAARRHGLMAHLEDTGRRGRRLWVFFERPEPLRRVRAAWVRIEDEVGPPPPDLVRLRTPAQDRVRPGSGPWVPLPLGRDPRGGPSRWFDHDLREPGENPAAVVRAAATEQAAVLRVLFGRADIGRGEGGAPQRFDPRMALADLPDGRRVLEGCGVLRALAGKALELGRLEGTERATLYESLLHLPEVQRLPTLATLLEPTGDRAPRIEHRLRRVPGCPISCASIRRRHAPIAQQVGCDCRFVELRPGAYPTPVLHTLRVDEVGGFPEPRKARNGKTGGARPTASRRPEASTEPAAGAEAAARATPEGPAQPQPHGEANPSNAPLRPRRMPAAEVEARRAARAHEAAGAADDTMPSGEPPRGGNGPSAAASASDAAAPPSAGTTARAEKIVAVGASGPSSAASNAPAQAVPPGDGSDVQTLLKKVANARRQVDDAQRGLERAEAALDALFDQAGGDRLRVAQGWLVRRPGQTPRFIIEV